MTTETKSYGTRRPLTEAERRRRRLVAPWSHEVHELSTGYSGIVYAANGQRVGADHLTEEEARLIAAAPTMLDALERAREAVNAIVLSTRSVSFDADLRAIDRALDAARGTSADLANYTKGD